MFITYLDYYGYAASTIMTYIGAISYVLNLAERPNPCQTFLVKKLLNTIAKNSNPQIPKKPITREILLVLLQALDRLLVGYERLLAKAIFSWMFHLCARVGELTLSKGNRSHILSMDQIKLVRNNNSSPFFRIQFKSYKHRKAGHCPVLELHSSKDASCPVTLMTTYLSQRPKLSGPIFIGKNGKVIPSNWVSQILSQSLALSRINPKMYSSHGFRAGGATDAARRGASDAQIRLMGRWVSDAFKRYIRPDILKK